MGKSRRSRTKRHISSVQPDTSETNAKSYPPLPHEFMSKAPVIQIVDKTASSTNDGEDWLLNKKERQKIRRERWLKKIDATQVQNKPKHHHTPVIVGDLEPLKSALTELEHVSHTTNKTKQKSQAKQPSTTKKSVTRKRRQQVLVSEVKRFSKVLQHKAFKQNPIEAITQHLQNVAKQSTNLTK